MILQHNIENIIFNYKSHSVDYNKIETSRIWQLTVLTYSIIPPRPNIRIHRYCTFTYRG